MEAALNEDKPYIFRPYIPDDIPFIQGSWGKSYYTGVNGNNILSPEEFHAHHRPIREAILAKSNVAIIVCVASQDPDLIIGYSIVEKPKANCLILHYLYVKHDFKGEKIGQELLKKSLTIRPVLYTHSTIIAGKILKKFKETENLDFDRFIFTPHLI